MKSHTQPLLQNTRSAMVLPLLVTPFLGMIFWALGGGQGTATNEKKKQNAGLNLELPNAQFEKQKNAWDKLALYQKAERDSIKFNEARRNDPYFKLSPLKSTQDTSHVVGHVNSSLGKNDDMIDRQELQINQKLTELHRVLDAPEPRAKPRYQDETSARMQGGISQDVDRLEAMMQMMQSDDASGEEMKQMQVVLDKILDIQHPQRVTERDKGNFDDTIRNDFTLSHPVDNSIGVFGSVDSLSDNVSQNRFYTLDQVSAVEKVMPNGIEAEVYGTQALTDGAVVKLQLIHDVYLGRMHIPRNRFVYGVCSLNGERLVIKIKSVQNSLSVYPVSLSVFDLDGLEGIHVPGAVARDVAKQSSSQSLQEIGLSGLNPSLEAQAASAGLATVKNLVNKKARQIRVTINAGYKVLLIDTKSKTN